MSTQRRHRKKSALRSLLSGASVVDHARKRVTLLHQRMPLPHIHAERAPESATAIKRAFWQPYRGLRGELPWDEVAKFVLFFPVMLFGWHATGAATNGSLPAQIGATIVALFAAGFLMSGLHRLVLRLRISKAKQHLIEAGYCPACETDLHRIGLVHADDNSGDCPKCNATWATALVGMRITEDAETQEDDEHEPPLAIQLRDDAGTPVELWPHDPVEAHSASDTDEDRLRAGAASRVKDAVDASQGRIATALLLACVATGVTITAPIWYLPMISRMGWVGYARIAGALAVLFAFMWVCNRVLLRRVPGWFAGHYRNAYTAHGLCPCCAHTIGSSCACGSVWNASQELTPAPR